MAQTPAIFKQEGDRIDYTFSADATSGDVIELGSIPMIVVADVDFSENALGTLNMVGSPFVPQKAEIITAGDAVYWDDGGDPVTGGAGTGAATGTAAGNVLMGFALATTAAIDTYVHTRLTAAMRTATIAGSMTADDITGSDSSLNIAGFAAAQGGSITVTGGTSATAGLAGGAVSIVGGTPGVTGVGGALSITAGAGGATSGTGGALAIAAGAGTNGDADGGDLSINAGALDGSGADGDLTIGTANTAAITIGATSVATAIPGPVTLGIGGSTVAAGSSTGDAGALPAATAPIYPTTAADDTKGVVIHADDKVTGRELFIGNGVGNKLLKVYPPSGGNINALGADTAFSSVSGASVRIVCLDSSGNTWLAM